MEIVTLHFQGAARTWWNQQVQQLAHMGWPPVTEWQQLVTIMTHKYLPRTYRKDMKTAIALATQGRDTPHEFFTRLEDMYFKAGVSVTPSTIRTRFVSGLSQPYRDQVDALPIRDLKNVVQTAQKLYLQAQRQRQQPWRSSSSSSARYTSNPVNSYRTNPSSRSVPRQDRTGIASSTTPRPVPPSTMHRQPPASAETDYESLSDEEENVPNESAELTDEVIRPSDHDTDTVPAFPQTIPKCRPTTTSTPLSQTVTEQADQVYDGSKLVQATKGAGIHPTEIPTALLTSSIKLLVTASSGPPMTPAPVSDCSIVITLPKLHGHDNQPAEVARGQCKSKATSAWHTMAREDVTKPNQGRFPSFLPILSTSILFIEPIFISSLPSVLQIHRNWTQCFLPRGLPPIGVLQPTHRMHDRMHGQQAQLMVSNHNANRGRHIFTTIDMVWLYTRKARLLVYRPREHDHFGLGDVPPNTFEEDIIHLLELPIEHGVRPPDTMEDILHLLQCRLLGWLSMGFPPLQRLNQLQRIYRPGQLQLRISRSHHSLGSDVFSLFNWVWFYYRKARLLAFRQFTLAYGEGGYLRFNLVIEIRFHLLELPEKHGVRPPSSIAAEHDLGEARTLHS